MTDPVDGLILEEAAPQLAGVDADQVAVLDDVTGTLALHATPLTRSAAAGARGIRVYCDSLVEERGVAAATSVAGVPVSLQPELPPTLRGVAVVLVRLPKSLAALDEIVEAVARYAVRDVQLVAGGRTKHMSLGMNRTLARHFDSVTASLGRQKSRVLRASQPRTTAELSYPGCQHHPDLDLTVCAHGAAFGGTSVDLGTRFLLSFLPQLPVDALDVVDLGCGTGVLAAVVARQLPASRVLAVDESAAACRSAAATAVANGVAERVSVQRVDLLTGTEDSSVDLVLCNPPFHRGSARDSDVAFAMFADAARTLRPGGELWTVYNTHLPYLPALRRMVGPTQIRGQNRRYLVTRSVAAARA